MDIDAKYNDENSKSININTGSEKEKNADKLISTGSQKDKKLESFIKKDQQNITFRKDNNLFASSKNFSLHSNYGNKNYSNINTYKFSQLNKSKNFEASDNSVKNRFMSNKSKKLKNNNLLKSHRNFNIKEAAKTSGLMGVNLLNESEEFKDVDKVSDKAATLKKAKDIADKVKKARRTTSMAKSTARRIKATEKIITAQQTAQRAASVKSAAVGTKAIASTGGAIGSAASAPVLGIIACVFFGIVCIIAFVTLLMTILSNKSNDTGLLTGIEKEIAAALMDNGYDKIHTAAIMGNMSAESGFNSKALQDVGDFENLEGDNRINDHGYGLNQMTNGRKNNLCTLAEQNKTNHCDIGSQVKYFCTPAEKSESNWNKSLWRNYDCIPISRRQWEQERENLEILTVTLMAFWERPSYDPAINHVELRKNEAQRIFSALNSGGGDGTILGEAQAIANDDSHGYDYTYGSCRTLNPDVDCSSFVFYSLKNAGYRLGDYPFTTYDMGGILKSIGFQEFGYTGFSNCFPGDILWNSGHTEIYVGNGSSIGAHNDIDGKPGDSTGQEVNVGSADQGWTLVYRAPVK